jgi:hypothetical protein
VNNGTVAGKPAAAVVAAAAATVDGGVGPRTAVPTPPPQLDRAAGVHALTQTWELLRPGRSDLWAAIYMYGHPNLVRGLRSRMLLDRTIVFSPFSSG